MSLITAIRQRGHLTISSALLWHKRGVSSLSRICLSNGMTLLISGFPCNYPSQKKLDITSVLPPLHEDDDDE